MLRESELRGSHLHLLDTGRCQRRTQHSWIEFDHSTLSVSAGITGTPAAPQGGPIAAPRGNKRQLILVRSDGILSPPQHKEHTETNHGSGSRI